MSNSTPLDYAPAAVSRSRKASINYSQVTVGGRSALRIRSCVPLCEIGNDPYQNGLYIQGTAGAFVASVANLNPYSVPTAFINSASPGPDITGAWISPHIPLLALAFDRYRMQSLEFIYEPQSTATVDDRLVFAWTDDPSHPFLSATGSDYLGAAPSQLELLVTEDSMAFMPWKSWTLKVPVAKDDRFMYDFAGETATDTSTSNRFCDFGAFSCVASASPASAVQYGILYIMVTLDLFDPVPIVSSVTTLLASLHAAKKKAKAAPSSRRLLVSPPLLSTERLTALESKEEKKTTPSSIIVACDDELDGVPVTPPPSTRGPVASSSSHSLSRTAGPLSANAAVVRRA
jgi:hypothetical protein